MWTNNGKKFFLYRLLNKAATLKTSKNTDYGFSISYSYKIADYRSLGTRIGEAETNCHGFAIYCGGNDNTILPEDYTLQNPLSLTYINGSNTDTGVSKTFQYTVQNNNTESITIKELALCVISNGNTALINHKVLPTPITLAVGEQAIITYTVNTSNIIDGDGWTNNFKLFANNQFLYLTAQEDYLATTNTTASGNLNNFVSSLFTTANYPTSMLASGTTIRYKMGIFVGQGTNPTTPEDYILEAPVSLSLLSSEYSIDENFNLLISFTMKNNSTETYTITEIGLCAAPNAFLALLNRKLLPTPVVMEPNDTYVFTYTININNLSE